MKAKIEMDPLAAFPDGKHRPNEADLQAALGRAAPPVETVVGNLRRARPAVETAWQYSKQSGWYMLLLLKKRRLLYLVPKRGDAHIMLILGRKAIAQLQAGPFARKTTTLLKTARHYPEGTAFRFNRRTLDPGLLDAMLAAKLAT